MARKLIEVALPLDAINAASAREKSIRHGHPSTLHLWWARRPLAAARAVLFAQMVDDPASWPDLFPTEKVQEKERRRLFGIIEELVKWENTTNEQVLQAARDAIWQSWRRACAENADHPRAAELFDRHKLPAFHDPFAGGGALPLEAQRLGLEAHASDLNPVAVLINKAMIEIPPRFAGRPPVNPDWQAQSDEQKTLTTWTGAQGLAEDVRYYGQWMRDEAEKRIGHLYPKIEITEEMAKERPDLERYVGRKLTVIAWLWARTVKSPNPAFADVDVPLVSTFLLSTKQGREAYVEPVIEGRGYRFTVKVGKPEDAEAAKAGTKLSHGANFRCLMSGAPIAGDYIKAEGQAGRMGARLLAVVAEGDRGRVYLAPTPEHEAAARQAKPEWQPDVEFFQKALGFRVGNYGMTTWSDLFTARQLVALTTFCDLVAEARTKIIEDYPAREPGSAGVSPASGLARTAAGETPALPGSELPLRAGGTGATAYAEAVGMYLGLGISKLADAQSSLCRWKATMDQSIATFGRQALPMVWDYSEANTLGKMAGDPLVSIRNMMRVVERLPSNTRCRATQADAQSSSQTVSLDKLVSTDPPYYDNVGYADLSDFFYVWLRRSLRSTFPELFATLAVPKAEELVATPYRHGSKDKAEAFFMTGMTHAMERLAEQAHPGFPVTIYYAFKQVEKATGGRASGPPAGGTPALPGVSTGWETFLDAIIRAGFAISGTWPMRTELSNRMRGMDSNALASSIVLVCRKRPDDAPVATRREFVTALKTELPAALANMQRGNIAPVDLAQAAIGPGMAVYTRYAKVLDAAGKPVSVREALALINQTLDEVLAEQEGDFDADSRWALAWFEQHGFDAGEYGVAETLSKAKNTSVGGLAEAGIVESKAGTARLLKPAELPDDWDPARDSRLTAWEMVHHLIRVLETGGETAAAALTAQLGAQAETARELCYRLYTLCERKKRATEALSYNGLVQSWPEISRLAQEAGRPGAEQAGLFGER